MEYTTRMSMFANSTKRPNPSIEGMPKRLRLSVTPHVKRSSALRADERARVESNVGFSGAQRRRTLVRASPLRGDSNPRSSVTPAGRLRRPVLAAPPPTNDSWNLYSSSVGRQVGSVRDDAQLAPVGRLRDSKVSCYARTACSVCC